MSTHPLTHPCTPAPLARRSNSGAFPVYTVAPFHFVPSLTGMRTRIPAYPRTRIPAYPQENGGAPLTHKQQRILKKMKKAEEAAAKRAAAAAAL